MPARPDPPAHESEDEGDDVVYMLGFVEPPEKPTDLLRHRFPSKVGGAPAWLDPVNLPTQQQLTCGVSGQIMKFLLQVYCPVDDGPADAFHRALFVFISPKGSDLTQPGAVRAFRCQLPRSNPFYADTPAPPSQLAPNPLSPDEQQLSLSRDPWQVLTREQQGCAGGSAAAVVAGAGAGPAVFTEQELVVDAEPDEGEGSGGQDDEVQRLLSAYNARIADEGEYDEQELPSSVVDDLEGAAGPARQAFAAFQVRTARAPEQCLRYCFQPGATPLWLSHTHRPAPTGSIPPCPHCGAERQFECQVMPQLLSCMDLDVEDPQAPDWGTLVVYSCPSSCSARPVESPEGHSAYIEEFVWVQPS